MKTNLLITSIILASMLTLTSCSRDPSQDTKDPSVTQPEAAELMVYENPKTASQPQSGGGFDVNPINTTDVKLNYNYDDLGDIRAYFKSAPKGHNGDYIYEYVPGAGGVDFMPSTGNVNLLVIPVKFADYDLGATDQDRQDIYNAYFGSKEDIGGYESVRTFFDKTSFGALQISGVVTDWYHTDYTTKIGQNDTGDADAVATLTGKAFEWFKKTYNSDGSEFDSDHDGYVDAICLIYNAPAKYGPDVPDNQLWAYCFWRTAHRGTASKPNANAFFWASTSFMHNHSNKDILDTHTYIHELGHVMGLDDYYNYFDQKVGATGGYIMEDMNIGDHDPFSKMALNWVTPTLVTGSTTIELKSFTETGQVLILKPDTDGFNSPFDEYLAIELYTPTGLNEYDTIHKFGPGFIKGPKTSGLRIWHVDARLLQYNEEGNYVVTTTYEKNSTEYDYILANTNTHNGPYASKVADFRDFRLLHSIQAGFRDTYKHGSLLSSADLFGAGDFFNMGTYGSFFANRGKFNSGKSFNVSLDVLDIKNNVAKIKVEM